MKVRAEMLMVAWRAIHSETDPYELNLATKDFLDVYESASWKSVSDFWMAVVAERSQPDEARELGLSILKEVDTAVGFDGGKG